MYFLPPTEINIVRGEGVRFGEGHGAGWAIHQMNESK